MMPISCANDDVNFDAMQVQRNKSLERLAGFVRGVTAAKKYKNTLDQAIALPDVLTRQEKFRSEQCVTWPQQLLATERNKARIPRAHIGIEILVEQHVGVMRTVGKIVNHHETFRLGP